MDKAPPELRTRLLFGAIAGFAATAAMTSAMARLHRRLPRRERYPLPPREIMDSLMAGRDQVVRDAAMAAHFLYGAVCGALVNGISAEPRASEGALAGVAIWAGGYFGWVPAFGILKPASRHPARRNALMAGAHIVWGATTALALREMYLARRTILNDRPPHDVPYAAFRRRA